MASGSQALLDSLKSANLLPSKVIPENFNSTTELSVTFGSKTVRNGNFFRVSEVKTAPTITFSSTSQPEGATYTLLLIDPDAPTPDDPKFAYWRHWVITNIPSASSTSASTVEAGTTLTQYLAPGPKDESGPHRYHFLLYREPSGFNIQKSEVGGEEFVERRSFPAAEWVSKHGLELVGVQWMRGVGDGWKGDENL